MKEKKIVSIMLCFLLSCGLVIGIVRYMTFQTILDESWYDEIRSKIYFIDRVKDAINQEMIQITKTHDKTLDISWKLLPQKEIKEYFDAQITMFILHMKNPNDDQMMNLTTVSKERINNMVSSSLILPKKEIHLSESELVELEELKQNLINSISPYLMEDDNKDGMVDYTTQVFLILSRFTEDFILLIIVLLILCSLIGLVLYHYLNRLSFLGIISLTTFMTGSLLLLFNRLNKLPYIKPSRMTLYDEFSLASAIDVSKKTVFLGKQLIAISLITTLIVIMFKEYKRLNTYTKKDT